MVKRIVLSLAGVALLAGAIIAWPKFASRTQHPASAQDAMALTQSVFETRGCNSCHTVSSNGTLGFNEKGKRLGQDFEGCSRMLAAMNLIAQVDQDQRSPQQRKIAARFDEFGCGFCHKITPGKLGLTEVGSKLGNLHLKCVAVDSCCRRPS
ncbi:MAG TPA: hypothetical protein VKT49_24165 [Bryobacteraceae bacterium]|nr:hypothetical protein [Bryobacteraceae bacterium]